MKTIKLLKVGLLSLFYTVTFAQTTVTLQPEKDAVIRELAGTGDNTNYGNEAYVNMHAWTNGGNEVVHRSLINFDLSNIPNGSTILNSELYLYSDQNSTAYPNGHDLTSGSNSCVIKRIISSWTENSVTWNSQPGTSVVNQVTIPQSTSSFQDYIINVTSLVQDMIDDASNSFGFRINLQDETSYRRLVFASQDNVDITIHPKLVITYNAVNGVIESDFNPLVFSLFPNPTNNYAVLTFENSIKEKFTLMLFDGLGRLLRTVTEITAERVVIEKKGLDSGMYFFQLKSEGSMRAYGKLKID